jgi:hypothetical protein
MAPTGYRSTSLTNQGADALAGLAAYLTGRLQVPVTASDAIRIALWTIRSGIEDTAVEQAAWRLGLIDAPAPRVTAAELTRRLGLPADRRSDVIAWTGDPLGTEWTEADAAGLIVAWHADAARIASTG